MTMTATIRIFTDPTEARETILKRKPLDQIDVPPSIAAGIERIFGERLTPAQVVERILADVREKGDAALRAYTQRIDGVELDALAVTGAELDAAWHDTPPELREALELAADRVRQFYAREPKDSWMDWRDGEAYGQIVRPLERVGVYVPGGTAPLPSSLLMAAIPAQVAGVRDIIACSPPEEDGRIKPVTLAAARAAGVTQVFKLGGAQAIAGLAYGTESIPQVDKIVGPGNLFVVLAKKAVYGVVDIESLPGPTETLLIADDSANPAWVAADLLAQSEHIMGSSILLTTSTELAEATQREVERQLPDLRWRESIAESLDANGGIVIVRDLDQAVELANEYAAEHLCLLTRDPWALVGRIRNAGGIFVGEASSEALGDYIAGPSHIMPTGGTARFASPVHVRDFLKVTSIINADLDAHNAVAPAAVEIAEAESLTAHAAALRKRVEG
ncbi:MAG: Histidinol dehydrogenase [Anaerolineales bacterium]|nr:Histidinol dehydrogenase [Anaerolineales bacterium]